MYWKPFLSAAIWRATIDHSVLSQRPKLLYLDATMCEHIDNNFLGKKTQHMPSLQSSPGTKWYQCEVLSSNTPTDAPATHALLWPRMSFTYLCLSNLWLLEYSSGWWLYVGVIEAVWCHRLYVWVFIRLLVAITVTSPESNSTAQTLGLAY